MLKEKLWGEIYTTRTDSFEILEKCEILEAVPDTFFKKCMECMGCLFRDYDAVTQASISLTMNSQHMRRLERFTVLMYIKDYE